MQARCLFPVTHLGADRDSNTEVNAALQLLFFTSCLAASLWKQAARSQQPASNNHHRQPERKVLGITEVGSSIPLSPPRHRAGRTHGSTALRRAVRSASSASLRAKPGSPGPGGRRRQVPAPALLSPAAAGRQRKPTDFHPGGPVPGGSVSPGGGSHRNRRLSKRSR